MHTGQRRLPQRGRVCNPDQAHRRRGIGSSGWHRRRSSPIRTRPREYAFVSTATEINNAGFDILRSSDGNSWSKLGFVQGSGTKSTPTNYLFKDQKLTTGGYFYKLKQVDYNGSFKYSNKVYAFISTPAKFSLEQNYPNPFNPVTTIMFSIPKEVMVNITVFNVVGEKVCELKNEVMKPGYYQVDFDASKIASGVYFYRLQAGDFMITKKMNLLK